MERIFLIKYRKRKQKLAKIAAINKDIFCYEGYQRLKEEKELREELREREREREREVKKVFVNWYE